MTDPNTYNPGLSIADVQPLAGDREIAKLSSNENLIGPSPLAVEAATAALTDANFYPPRTDAALCAALADMHGRGLSTDNIFAANGGMEVLSLAEDALLTPDHRAIICPPAFGSYANSLSRKGIQIDRVPLTEPDYLPDPDAILAAVTPQTRAVYLCNPNNPTGTWFGDDILTAILDGLPDHVTVIYDEVYFQFATDDPLPDAIGHVLNGRNLLIVHSFSKTYGLAGMRVGYGIAPAPLVARIRPLLRTFHVNGISLTAAQAALGDTGHLTATLDNNNAERPRLIAALRALGLAVWPSQTNFILFRCPDGMTAKDMTAALVAEGVMVRPAFDLPHHVRVSIGTPAMNDQFLTALAPILKG